MLRVTRSAGNTRLKAGRARPATNRPGASTSPLPDRVRPLAEASGPTLNAGEVVCRLRDFRIVAAGHRIEQPRLCAVDVIGRALPHRLPGSVLSVPTLVSISLTDSLIAPLG